MILQLEKKIGLGVRDFMGQLTGISEAETLLFCTRTKPMWGKGF